MSTIPEPNSDPERWVTRDELAALAGISVDTVIRDCAKHGFEVRYDDRGRALVQYADFIEIERIGVRSVAVPAEVARLARRIEEFQYDIDGMTRELELGRALLEQQFGLPHVEA